MESNVYLSLQRKIIAITLVVALAPLMVLGSIIYFKFSGIYREKVGEQILYRAKSQAETLDLFLKESDPDKKICVNLCKSVSLKYLN